MLIFFRFMLLFRAPCRFSVHTLIKKKYIYILIWCIAAAFLFTHVFLATRHLASVQSYVRVGHAHYLMGRM